MARLEGVGQTAGPADWRLHMREIILCPKCRKRLQLQPEDFGKQVQCPACETQFEVRREHLEEAFGAGALPPPALPSSATPEAEQYEPTTPRPRRSRLRQ